MRVLRSMKNRKDVNYFFFFIQKKVNHERKFFDWQTPNFTISYLKERIIADRCYVFFYCNPEFFS